MTGIVKTDQIQGAQGTTVTIPSGQKLGIGTSSPNTIVDIAGDTSTLTLEDTSSHSANTGPAISFKSKDSGGTTREVAKIVGESHSGSNEGNLAFQTRNGGTLETKWKVFKNGNLLPSNSGYGIYLGTTTASGDANLLDDYEEGTWTPNVGGNATYNNQQGIYTKIGRLCFVRGDITINVLGTGSANTLSGLPFSGNYQGTPQGAINVMYYSNVAQNYLWMSGYVLNNSTSIYFSGNNTYATTIQYNGSNIFGNSARVLFSATYTVD